MSEGVLESLTAIAREAAALVLEVYETPFRVDYKEENDPVTDADRRANALICTRLEQSFGGVPVVAEESLPEAYASFRSSSRIFFVDPLDGTKEFVAKNGEFAVMIGLLDGDRPAVGVLFSPAQGVAWAGEVGRGAWREEADGTRTPLSVSSCTALSSARIAGSRSHHTAETRRTLDGLGALEQVTLGSAGLKGAAVAQGRLDAVVYPSRAGWRWDACAVEAVVRAAGGKVTDAYGALLDYRSERLDNDRGLIISNGRVHDEILTRIAASRSED